MANEIYGNIHRIGETLNIPTKNGSNFQRRELIVVQHRFSQDTGEPLADNYVLFEVTQQKCAELDKFHIGDRVRVAFAVEGRQYAKDGKEMYFNSLRAYRIEAAQMPVAQQPQQAAQAPIQQPQQAAPMQYAPQPQQAGAAPLPF